MDDYSQRRRSKQPLDKPSAGSTFKRPEGHFAGKLIEDAGLKGFSIGGAQVSEKHCGFVVNTGGATSADILRLIDAVKARVYEASGVTLEPEVRMIGEF
jgi:UDP-N-acetylmuramate dehydrogenase